MKLISNKGTFTEKIGLIIFIPIVMIFFIVLVTIILINEHSKYVFYPLVIFLILAIISGLISLDYAKNLKSVGIRDDHLFVKGLFKKQSILFSNIKSITTHWFFFLSLSEKPFIIKFDKKTQFGKKIYVNPTHLDQNKELRFNLGIKNELIELVKKQNDKLVI